MDFGYTFEDGYYNLHVGGQLRAVMPQVAILFDRDQAVVLAHGVPELVIERYNNMLSAFAQHRDDPHVRDVSESLTLLCGRFDPNEVNKALHIGGYVSRLHEQEQSRSMDLACAELRRIASLA